MRHPETTAERIRALKGLGVRVAIDDFGAGYSSLSYLRRFPVDVLKIDRSFVTPLQDSEESVAVVHALVQLGKALNLKVVAEGVEAEAQLSALRREQCDIVQGYLFSRPQDPSLLQRFLAEWTPAPPVAPKERSLRIG